jgi:hypothetical protein
MTTTQERLIIMAGTEQIEWHQTPGNHVFDVFDTIPLIQLQSLPLARSPQLRCHQPPVIGRMRILWLIKVLNKVLTVLNNNLNIKTAALCCIR